MPNTYEFADRYGHRYELAFERGAYRYGGTVAIEVWCRGAKDLSWEPYATLTTNLDDGAADARRAYLDTNNVADLVDYVIDKGWANVVGTGRSGYCEYPLVEFTDGFLDDVCIQPPSASGERAATRKREPGRKAPKPAQPDLKGDLTRAAATAPPSAERDASKRKSLS